MESPSSTQSPPFQTASDPTCSGKLLSSPPAWILLRQVQAAANFAPTALNICSTCALGPPAMPPTVHVEYQGFSNSGSVSPSACPLIASTSETMPSILITARDCLRVVALPTSTMKPTSSFPLASSFANTPRCPSFR